MDWKCLRVILASAFFLLTVPAYAAEFTRDLYLGLRNDPDVVRLQDFLRQEGFFSYPESTGNYFTVTQSAVAKFQHAHGITPTAGYFGTVTRLKTNSIISGDFFTRNLASGLRRDPDVIKLQKILRSLGFFKESKSTGNYFSSTEQAVRSYQASRRIATNGQIDTITRFFMNQEIKAGIIEIDTESTRTTPRSETATSTYHGVVSISGFSGKSTDPLRESVTITNRSRDKTVDITDWTLESSRGAHIVIPQAYNLPGLPESNLGDILLTPRGTVIITVGMQDKRMNFRENMCTGYFAEQSKFQPSLSRRCPRVDTADLTYLDDKCLRILPRIGSCRMPTQDDFFAQSSECSAYMVQNLSYAGCVRNNRTSDDFFLNRWLIWLQRRENEELFRNIHDTITLRDLNGKFVDQREY